MFISSSLILSLLLYFHFCLDTGETFGVIPADESTDNNNVDDFNLILLDDNGNNPDVSDDEENDSDNRTEHRGKGGKGNAAAWLARMEGTKTMARRIAGEPEKRNVGTNIKLIIQ